MEEDDTSYRKVRKIEWSTLSPEQQARIKEDLAEARRRLEEYGIRVVDEVPAEEQPAIGFDDLIGNSEAKALLKGCIDALFQYGPAERSNPALEDGCLPRSVLLTGSPGSGKTTALLTALSYARGLAGITDTSLTVVDAGCLTKRSLYAGHSRCLEEALDSALSAEGVAIIHAEDIDELFAHDLHRSAFQPVLARLEDADYAGRMLFIATAQDAGSIEPAVRDRIAQFEAHCPGPAYARASRDSQTEPEGGEQAREQARKG